MDTQYTMSYVCNFHYNSNARNYDKYVCEFQFIQVSEDTEQTRVISKIKDFNMAQFVGK